MHLLIRDHKRGHNLRGLWSIEKFLYDCIHAHAPVHFIVPLRDRYVGPALSLGLETWVGPHSRDEIDAGHWVVLRDPGRVAASIDAFIGEREASRQTAGNVRVNIVG